MKIWVWLWVVWTAGVMRVRGKIHISGETKFCTHFPNQTLICDLTNQPDRDAVMTEGNNQTHWNDWIVINASSLVLTEQCFARIEKVTVESSQAITTTSSTARKTGDCLYILVLEDSQANYISHVTKNIKLINSVATKINLNSVEQFDMLDSTVHDMNIKATLDKSTIVKSVITDITRMVLEGDFQFQAEDSTISNVHDLTYNTSNGRSVIKNVIIDRVYTNGLVIANGPLLMEEVTFKTLDSTAFIIELNDSLTIRNSVFINVEVDSLILSRGSLQFENVTIGSYTGVSIRLAGAAGGVKPLAFILDCPSSKPWIVGVVVSLVAGIVVGGAAVYFAQGRMKKMITQDKDRIELLSPDAPSSTKSPDLTSKPLSPSPVPERSPPPIPVEDDDQWYDDVNVRDSVQQEHGAPPLPASRPPLQTNLSPKETEEDESNEEPVYEDVCSPDTAQPQSFFPGNAPHLPGHPPGFVHTPYNGPPPPLGPPLPIKESFEANKNQSLINEVPEKLKTPKPRPPPPPSRTNSALSSAKFSSSSSDDRDHLPPPPPPTDDAETYDDVADIHTDTRNVAKPPSVTNKPSFLHTTPKPANKPDWVRNIPGASKPPGTGAARGGATQQPKRPPPAKPPAPPNHPQPPSAKSTFSDEEDIYEEIE